MRGPVSKWGNSLAIRLPHAAVKSLHVREGEQVALATEGDRLELRSARPRYRLEELIGQITPDNQPESIDVPPVSPEERAEWEAMKARMADGDETGLVAWDDLADELGL